MIYEKPLVSAIVSVYNSEKFFKGKIEDLLNQTISDKLEIIIINSGSQQGEEEIYKKYFRDNPSIKYIKTEERETIYKAWNRGISIAKGKYITNSNTDDRLRKDALEVMSDALEKKPKAALVYGDQYVSNIPNETFEDAKNHKKKINPVYSKLVLLSGYLAGSQPMWRSSLHLRDGIYFDEKYEVTGDYDFICRISERYDLLKVNQVLGVYYLSDKQSNKEYQNISLTLSEAANVQDIYSRRYISNASPEELKKLTMLVFIYSHIPHLVYAGIWRIYQALFPSKRAIPRSYMLYLGSIINEIRGDFESARKLCRKYLGKNLTLIELQFNNLETKNER